ncbi:MAG: hypothetical protein ACKO0Z_01735, partial [Betaproteobacteria bacterium]
RELRSIRSSSTNSTLLLMSVLSAIERQRLMGHCHAAANCTQKDTLPRLLRAEASRHGEPGQSLYIPPKAQT